MVDYHNTLNLFKRLIPLAVLYGGRVGTAALGLLMLPWLNLAMPAGQFGLAATVLSLQSLAVVFDLGLSITIARELPVVTSAKARMNILWYSERTLITLYFLITIVAIFFSLFTITTVKISTVMLVCLSMLLVVWQNIVVVAFISTQRFIYSTLTQFASILFRFGIVLVFVSIYNNSLEYFVFGHILGSFIILIISRLLLFVQNRPDNKPYALHRPTLASNLFVIIYTVSGACALQIDKVLLTLLASPKLTGPYFLASILSLVPITFLASPVSQFMQPKIIISLELDHTKKAQQWILVLTVAILILAVLPGLVIASCASLIIPLWLQGSPQQTDVIRYVQLVMPGASFGALGLVPAIVLIYRRDYRALAIMSCVMTLGVLLITTTLALRGFIDGVCIAYAVYHAASAVVLWWRAWRIEPNFANSFGFYSNAG